MAMGLHEDFGTKYAICGESLGKHRHAQGYALKPVKLKTIKTAAAHLCELVKAKFGKDTAARLWELL